MPPGTATPGVLSPRLARQRSDQLGDVQRIARRAVGQPQQLVVGLAADQGGDELGDGRIGQPGELQAYRIVHRSPQRQQVIPLRHRPHHPDQQQRHLPHRPGQPPPQRDAGLIGPLKIIDDQDGRLRGALLAGEEGVALAIRDARTLRLLGSHDAALALHVTGNGARLIDVSVVDTAARPSLDPATEMRMIVGGTPPTIAVSSDGDVWSLAQLGVAAMQVGVAESALALIVEYAKVRETFGRKIGTYQAVRHACADMALRGEAALCQLWSAAAAFKERRSDAQAHLDAAKHLANRAAVTNADVDIQLHGGIGVTEEHHAHLLLKHSLLLARLFGSERTLLARLLHAELDV